MKIARLRPAVLLMVLLLAACSHDRSDLEEQVAEIKATPGKPPEDYPKPTPYTPYAYVAGDRRDPFADAVPASSELAGEGANAPDLNRNREPLEEFPIDSLRMVGSIRLGKRMYGLVKAPDAVVHRVSVGDHMGQDFGEIVEVTETEIRLVERTQSGLNTWMERPAVLALTP